MLTYKDKDMRKAVALEQSKATDEAEAFADPKKKKIYLRYINEVKMAGEKDAKDRYIKGIEDYLTHDQYSRTEHQKKVVEDIQENWMTLSQAGKFHAIFSSHSIPEAIAYYRLIKEKMPYLKTTALFDPHIDNGGGVQFKEDGLVEILEDYNSRYGLDFTMASHGKYKKDISNRLAHKESWKYIDRSPEKQLDLLIVVDQMLTGFDSKWVNTLYMDKVLKYEAIIQAFSRTNRLFGPDKPFGTIRYYRFPHTMEQNINKAVKLYSGDKPLGLFVEQLDKNLYKMNAVFEEMEDLFTNTKIDNFAKLPKETSECGQIAKLFNLFNTHLAAAKVQGFTWDKLTYNFHDQETNTSESITLDVDENTYLIVALRYKELFSEGGGGNGGESVPYEIDGHLTEIDTGQIDAAYMNSRFDKFLKVLHLEEENEQELQEALNELHKSFSGLTQEEQKYAGIFLRDVQRGDVIPTANKTFRDYSTEYQSTAKDEQIRKISETLYLDQAKLVAMMNYSVGESTLNEYGRFDDLKNSVDREKAKHYFETLENGAIPPFRIAIKIHNLLKDLSCRGDLIFRTGVIHGIVEEQDNAPGNFFSP